MIKRYIPFAHAKSIFDIDVNFYKKLNVKYIFADLDNTLDSYKDKTPSKRTIEFINNLNKSGVELIITSNNTPKRVGEYASKLGVRYIATVGKPFATGLNKNITKLGLNKDEIILIGDQTTTDIFAANGAKIKNVLTDKIVEEDQPTTRFNRLFDKPIRKRLEKKGLLKDWRNF